MPWTDLQFRHSRIVDRKLFCSTLLTQISFNIFQFYPTHAGHHQVSFKVKDMTWIIEQVKPGSQMSQKTEIHIPLWLTQSEAESDTVSQVFPPSRGPQTTWGGNGLCYVSFTLPSPNKINVIFSSKQLHCTALFAPTFVWVSSRLIVVIQENIKSRLKGILLDFKDSVRPINVRSKIHQARN